MLEEELDKDNAYRQATDRPIEDDNRTAVGQVRHVCPGSGCWLFTHPGSQIQGSIRHRITDPDPQLWVRGVIPIAAPSIFVSVSHPYWIRIQSRQWIRIRNPDPDPGGHKWPTKVEKLKKFHVLKCWMFSFEGWRYKFFNFLSSKPWIRIGTGIQPKRPDLLDPYQMNRYGSETLIFFMDSGPVFS